MDGAIDLPDINVWLAFSVADHEHHLRARLAAFAKAAGLRLITFDKGFSRFAGLDLLHLKA